MSLTGIGLIAIPISAVTAYGLSMSNKAIYEIVMQKHNIYKKQYERDQQTFVSFDNLYRKSLQDNLMDQSEYESLFSISTRYFDETRN